MHINFYRVLVEVERDTWTEAKTNIQQHRYGHPGSIGMDRRAIVARETI